MRLNFFLSADMWKLNWPCFYHVLSVYVISKKYMDYTLDRYYLFGSTNILIRCILFAETIPSLTGRWKTLSDGEIQWHIWWRYTFSLSIEFALNKATKCFEYWFGSVSLYRFSFRRSNPNLFFPIWAKTKRWRNRDSSFLRISRTTAGWREEWTPHQTVMASSLGDTGTVLIAVTVSFLHCPLFYFYDFRFGCCFYSWA